MNFITRTIQGETREAWEARTLANYPNARFYRYADGGQCATSSSPLQSQGWSPAWRVAQWSRQSGGHVHEPENLALHLVAIRAKEQAFAALLEAVHDKQRHAELRALGLIADDPFASICTRIVI